MIKTNIGYQSIGGNARKNAAINTQGNAMIYILIAIALFAGLTLTLSRQNSGTDGQSLDDEVIGFYANELIEYVGSAQQVVNMMTATGSEIDDLDFVDPTKAAFNTGSPIHKVFHPEGGGLNYRPAIKEDIANGATSQWAVNTNINVEWTPTGAAGENDVLFTAYFINRDVCARINKLITGSETIPATLSPHAEYFLETGTTELNTTECPGCEGYSSLCVENNTGDNYSFYNIIEAR